MVQQRQNPTLWGLVGGRIQCYGLQDQTLLSSAGASRPNIHKTQRHWVMRTTGPILSFFFTSLKSKENESRP
jgi:hypothetical protein